MHVLLCQETKKTLVIYKVSCIIDSSKTILQTEKRTDRKKAESLQYDTNNFLFNDF